MKIAFISNHPAPYRDAFLARLVCVEAFKTDVYNLFSHDSGHAFWGLDQPHYKSKKIAEYGENSLLIFCKLLRILLKGYDVVIFPGFHHWYLKAVVLLAAFAKRRYVICADSVEQKRISRSAYWIKRYVIRHASFIFVPGDASASFFMTEFGVSHHRVQKGLYALDGKLLENEIICRRKRRDELCERIGVQAKDTIYLMVANMIKTRHYPITVQAFSKFAEAEGNCRFVIVGKGEDLERMMIFSKRHPSISVIPGCSFDEMLSLYAVANVYVHGGKEPASTALIIGALAHLPLISSMAVGCSVDVIVNRESGLLVPCYLSEKDWVEKFTEMQRFKSSWIWWGDVARQRSRCLDVDVIVKDFADKIVAGA